MGKLKTALGCSCCCCTPSPEIIIPASEIEDPDGGPDNYYGVCWTATITITGCPDDYDMTCNVVLFRASPQLLWGLTFDPESCDADGGHAYLHLMGLGFTEDGDYRFGINYIRIWDQAHRNTEEPCPESSMICDHCELALAADPSSDPLTLCRTGTVPCSEGATAEECEESTCCPTIELGEVTLNDYVDCVFLLVGDREYYSYCIEYSCCAGFAVQFLQCAYAGDCEETVRCRSCLLANSCYPIEQQLEDAGYQDVEVICGPELATGAEVTDCCKKCAFFYCVDGNQDTCVTPNSVFLCPQLVDPFCTSRPCDTGPCGLESEDTNPNDCCRECFSWESIEGPCIQNQPCEMPPEEDP
jgi:hypothetical protein